MKIKWELHRNRDGLYVLFGRFENSEHVTNLTGGKQIAVWLPASATDKQIIRIKNSILKAWGISDD